MLVRSMRHKTSFSFIIRNDFAGAFYLDLLYGVFAGVAIKIMTTDFLTGTVTCPGELPHEYLFVTKANEKRALANLYAIIGGK